MIEDQLVPWLRELAEKGGKGVVNNIDARCLGRIADEIERLRGHAQQPASPESAEPYEDDPAEFVSPPGKNQRQYVMVPVEEYDALRRPAQLAPPDTVQALAKFAKWALQNGPFDGRELDGGDVQAKAIELGLIVAAKEQDDWWVYSPDLMAALSAPSQQPASPVTDDTDQLRRAAWEQLNILDHWGAGPSSVAVSSAVFQNAAFIIRKLVDALPGAPAQTQQEPVAYRWKYDDETSWTLAKEKPDHLYYKDVICEPLYTFSTVTSTEVHAQSIETYTEICHNKLCPRGGTPVEIVGSATDAMRDRNLAIPDVAQCAPDGWVVVPKEPTDAMCECGATADDECAFTSTVQTPVENKEGGA